MQICNKLTQQQNIRYVRIGVQFLSSHNYNGNIIINSSSLLILELYIIYTILHSNVKKIINSNCKIVDKNHLRSTEFIYIYNYREQF